VAPPLLLGLRILAWRLRRLAVAVLLVLAACLVARQAAPPPAETAGVVVAARDLTAGHVLAAEDLRTVRLPADVVPTGTVGRVPALEGRWVVVDIPAGLPLVDGVLDADRFGIRAPAGTVAVPIRLADAAVAALLRPGDRIDLVAPGADPAEPGEPTPDATVLARAAVVLEVTREEAAGDGGLLGGGAQTPDPLVVVAVAVDEGHRLASAVGGSLGAVLVQGSGTGGPP
jgi:Flp pilus assembly protein CpaB